MLPKAYKRLFFLYRIGENEVNSAWSVILALYQKVGGRLNLFQNLATWFITIPYIINGMQYGITKVSPGDKLLKRSYMYMDWKQSCSELHRLLERPNELVTLATCAQLDGWQVGNVSGYIIYGSDTSATDHTHCVIQLQNWRFGTKLICFRPVVFSYSKIYVSYMQYISGNKTSILELQWQHFSRINPIVPFVNISSRGTLSIIRTQGVFTFH